MGGQSRLPDSAPGLWDSQKLKIPSDRHQEQETRLGKRTPTRRYCASLGNTLQRKELMQVRSALAGGGFWAKKAIPFLPRRPKPKCSLATPKLALCDRHFNSRPGKSQNRLTIIYKFTRPSSRDCSHISGRDSVNSLSELDLTQGLICRLCLMLGGTA